MIFQNIRHPSKHVYLQKYLFYHRTRSGHDALISKYSKDITSQKTSVILPHLTLLWRHVRSVRVWNSVLGLRLPSSRHFTNTFSLLPDKWIILAKGVMSPMWELKSGRAAGPFIHCKGGTEGACAGADQKVAWCLLIFRKVKADSESSY